MPQATRLSLPSNPWTTSRDWQIKHTSLQWGSPRDLARRLCTLTSWPAKSHSSSGCVPCAALIQEQNAEYLVPTVKPCATARQFSNLQGPIFQNPHRLWHSLAEHTGGGYCLNVHIAYVEIWTHFHICIYVHCQDCLIHPMIDLQSRP